MTGYTNLILRSLTSPYGDTTRGGVLSWSDVDQNFLYLKSQSIYSAESSGSTIILKKYDDSDIIFEGPKDRYVTGGTYDSGIATFINNFDEEFYVTGFTDTFVSGFTYSNNNLTLFRNQGLPNLNVIIDTMSGLTINGNLNVNGNSIFNTLNASGNSIFNTLSANTINATTVSGDGNGLTNIGITSINNLQSELDSKILKPTSPLLDDYLYYNGSTWVNKRIKIPVSSGPGYTLFLATSGSTLPGYELLSQIPTSSPEEIESATTNNNVVQIDQYATDVLGRDVIDGGIWEFNSFASVDIVTTGLTNILIGVYLKSSGGSETLLFTASTTNITTTAVTLYNTSVVEPIYDCEVTDRLVVRYSASTTNNFNTVVYLYHGGVDNYSHIHTPFVTLHNDLAGLQGGSNDDYYHLELSQLNTLTLNNDASGLHNHYSTVLGLTGGTVSGLTTFNNGLHTNLISATTVSATTFYGDGSNLFGVHDYYVTGATYSNNTFSFTNNSGSTFDVLFNTVTGLTVNGNLNVSDNTILNSLSANTISATTISGGTLYGDGSNLTGISTLTSNLLYVSVGGNNTTGARNNMSRPFLTLEAALSASTSGDTIMVFPGSYTATTTSTNGLAKNGVNWFFYPNTIVNKASAGDIFNTTSLTSFNVYGYASFNKTSGTGRIFNNAGNNIGFNFEALDLTNSTSDCFLIGTSLQLGGIEINIKIRNATSSAGAVINSGNAGSWNLNFNFNNISSTSTNAITMTGSISVQMNLNGRRISSSTANAYSGGYSNTVTFNVPSMSGLLFASGGGTYIINGYCGTITNNGGDVFLNGIATNITQTAGNFKGSVFSTITCSAGNIECVVENTGGGSPLHSISGGYVRIYPRYTYFYCNVTGGVFEILGNFSFNHLHSGGMLTVAGGRLVVNADLTMTAAATASNSNVFQLNSGILEIKSRVSNTIGNSESAIVKYAGGKLIINDATLLTNNSETPPIIATTAGLSVKVLSGGLSTNRPENGGTLAAKKQKTKLTVSSVASTSITLNDGTGGNETFTETNIVTYNTLTLLSQRMVVLINASSTLNITATQDTPGTDTYFYLESDVAGTPYTQSSLTNLSSTGIRENSYELTNTTSGLIIEDSDNE